MTYEGVTLTADSLLVGLASGTTTNDGDGRALNADQAFNRGGDGSQDVVVEARQERRGL